MGARTPGLELEGRPGPPRRSLPGLLAQGAPSMAPLDLVPPEALELLAARLLTPLQIQHYLTRVLEPASRLGEKPVTPAIGPMTLALDLHDLESTFTRYGDNLPAVAEWLNIRRPEVRAFRHGQLPPGRTEEWHNQLWAAGMPLGDHLAAAPREPATG